MVAVLLYHLQGIAWHIDREPIWNNALEWAAENIRKADIGVKVVYEWVDEPTADLTEPDETGAVDLGLSVKWAACNIGANSPEEYGNYYAWGEVEPKNDYIIDNYKFAKKKYGYYDYELPNGLSDITGTEFDAAKVNWGNNWRMPTKLDFLELINNTTFVITNYKGVEGIRIIGPNGNSIFIPNAGYWDKYGINAKATDSEL